MTNDNTSNINNFIEQIIAKEVEEENKLSKLTKQIDKDDSKDIHKEINRVEKNLSTKIIDLENKIKKIDSQTSTIKQEVKSTHKIISSSFAVMVFFIGVLWHIIWVKSVFTWNDNKSFWYNSSAYLLIITIPIILVLLMVLITSNKFNNLSTIITHKSSKKE